MCDEVQRQLPGYVDRTLPRGRRRLVGLHLRRCPDCQHAFSAERDLAAQLRVLSPSDRVATGRAAAGPAGAGGAAGGQGPGGGAGPRGGQRCAAGAVGGAAGRGRRGRHRCGLRRVARGAAAAPTHQWQCCQVCLDMLPIRAAPWGGAHETSPWSLLDGVAPFELGVVCEVFGVDRTDDGLPGFDFAVCSPDGRAGARPAAASTWSPHHDL